MPLWLFLAFAIYANSLLWFLAYTLEKYCISILCVCVYGVVLFGSERETMDVEWFLSYSPCLYWLSLLIPVQMSPTCGCHTRPLGVSYQCPFLPAQHSPHHFTLTQHRAMQHWNRFARVCAWMCGLLIHNRMHGCGVPFCNRIDSGCECMPMNE